ncbi:MAG: UbiA-like polyprenyltransferase [Polyangiales bacterium]
MITAVSKRAGLVKSFASLVKLSHTIFAAPFAVAAAMLATTRPHAEVTLSRVLAIAVCLVTGRTAAMAYNRLVDRDVDAINPRTKTREIPAGIVSPFAAAALVAACAVVFVLSAVTLGKWPGILAVPVMLVLLGYSHAKRFTWAAHLWLGVALSLAPGGAWLALGARPELGIVLLMLAVMSWVGGFDVLYSLQDEGFDREHGLRSIPSRFGVVGALRIARTLHVGTVSVLAASTYLLGGKIAHAAAVVVVAGLLAYEHSLVRRKGDSVDLSKIDKAFFDLNGWVSIAFCALVAVDVFLLRR